MIQNATNILANNNRKINKSVEDRFWEKVNKKGPTPNHMPHLGNCWNWTACVSGSGYGQIAILPRGRLNKYAHRFSWEIHNGPIPKCYSVLHHCDNPICVNPSHLHLGTQKDNIIEMHKRNRYPREANHAAYKLKRFQVFEIRSMIARGIEQNKIAKKFRVSETAIHRIKTGECWSHV